MTTRDDLTAFIVARLDEEEWAARGLAGTTWTAERLGDHDYEIRVAPEPLIHAVTPTGGIADVQREDVAEWIAAHHPRRALREVDGTRAMLLALGAAAGSPPWDSAFEIALRCTGITWSDHPDYRAEWAPHARRA